MAEQFIGSIVDRIPQFLTPFPYASAARSNSSGIFMHIVSRETALGMPLLQLNSKYLRRFITIDVDRKTASLDWSGRGVPSPNLIVVNPANGHAHLIYELAKPISLRDSTGRPGEALPVRLYKAVKEALTHALGGDIGYKGILTKNPLHPSWTSLPGRLEPYSLSELARSLDLTQKVHHADLTLASELVPGNRNNGLFDIARKWAYRIKRNYRFEEDFRGSVYDEVYRLNDEINDSLDKAECRSIAKSISDWVWHRYRADGKRRGIMGLDPTLSLQIRQKMGQEGACGFKVDNSMDLIRKAILALQREGKRVYIAEVARRSKLHRNTVSRHWSHFTGLLNGDYKISSVTNKLTSDSLPFPPKSLIPTQRCKLDQAQVAILSEKYSGQSNPRLRACAELFQAQRRMLN